LLKIESGQRMMLCPPFVEANGNGKCTNYQPGNILCSLCECSEAIH